MNNGEREKDEQRMHLNRQHLAEWNAQLAQEMRAQLALAEKHKRESSRSYLEEINVHDRTLLETHQRQALSELAHQNRFTRITMLKRHTQENYDLNQ